MTNLVVPDINTKVSAYAFYGYKSLSSVSVGENVVSIGEYAFSNCISLECISMPNTIPIPRYGLFEGDSVKVILLPTTESIPDYYMYSSSNSYSLNGKTYRTDNRLAGIKEIIISEGIVSIGNQAFHSFYVNGKWPVPSKSCWDMR